VIQPTLLTAGFSGGGGEGQFCTA